MQTTRNVRVAITGGIACGKSLFCALLEKLGAAVIDADEVTHRLEAPGGKAVRPLAERFGQAILAPDGGIDRPALARVVFTDAKARDDADAILHPLVHAEIRRWIETPRAAVKAAAIPLLFEAGWDDGWDAVVCIAAHEATQIERLVRTRGYTETQARGRIAAQMPVAEKAARSDYVVWNDADAETLAKEAGRVYAALLSRQDRAGSAAPLKLGIRK